MPSLAGPRRDDSDRAPSERRRIASSIAHVAMTPAESFLDCNQEGRMRMEQVSDKQAMAGRPPPSWRPSLEANWEEVMVAHAEARRRSSADGVRFEIRAVVHLGALLPADVQVECVVQGRECGHSGNGVRLWSVQSYRNGAFVYEASVGGDAIGDVAQEDLVVRVRPAHRDAHRLGAAPVVAAVRPVGSGSAPGAEAPMRSCASTW